MMTWLKRLIWTRLLSLTLALITASFLLFPIFPVSQDHAFTRWLTPVADAQGSFFRDLLERTGLYTPNRRGTAPTGTRVGGAGRGPICALAENEQINQVKALMPFQSVEGTDTELVGGLTIAARPTFWFYVPYISTPENPKRVAQFVLLDEDQHPVWNELINVELSERPRLVKYSLPHDLETEKLYSWYFSVICDSEKLSRNPIVRGWVQRVDDTPELQLALSQAPVSEKYLAYANKGIWFEMVDLLMDNPQQFSYLNRNEKAILLEHFGMLTADRSYTLESAEPTEREVVNGNQLPARM